jgi:hypothetical protein
MSKRESWPWYKWFPGKALSSGRWAQLDLHHEGLYRRLYDWAALATPASKRGWLYLDGHPMCLKEIAIATRLDVATLENGLKALMERGLIARNTVGAYGFPHFAKHQRGAHLRPRGAGTSMEHLRHKIGTNLVQDRDLEVQSTEVQSTEVQSTEVQSTENREKKRTETPAFSSSDISAPKREPTPAELEAWALTWPTGMNPASLYELAALYPADWVIEALRVARDRGKPTVSYVRGVLRNYARQGGPDKPRDLQEDLSEWAQVKNPKYRNA